MKKIQELISGFQHGEFKKFGDFISSPFFNKNKDILLLHSFIEEKLNNNPNFKPAEINFYDYLHNTLNFDNQRSRILISDYCKLIQKYFIQEQFEQNPVYQKILLLDSLSKRELPKTFNSILKDAREYQEKVFNKDEDFYYNNIYLEVESFNYNLERDEPWNEESYKKINKNLDLFFTLAKLNLLHYMYYVKNYVSEKEVSQLWLMDEVLAYLEQNTAVLHKDHPLLYMKYLVLQTITKPEDDKYYYLLKKFAFNNYKKLKPEITEYVFSALINYCITRRNLGDTSFKQERYKLFEFIEKNTTIYKGQFIKHVDFLNAVIAALDASKIRWAENFYRNYKEKLLTELKEDTLCTAMAQIYYAKKEYDKAIKTLSKVSYKSRYYYLRSKMILSKIYYDTSQSDANLYLLDAVLHYLKRNRQKIEKLTHEMFNKYFTYLLKLEKNLENKNKVKRFYKLLQTDANVASKEWLLSRYRAIIK